MGIPQSGGGAAPTAVAGARSAPPKEPPVNINVVWGPPTWEALHTFAELTSDRATWKKLTQELVRSIPCPECKIHFHAWIQARPLPLTGGGMREWIAALHNAVNTRTKKDVWPIERVIETYSEGGDRAKLAARIRAVHVDVRTYVGASVAGRIERALQTMRL